MRASRSAEPTHLSGHLSASFKRPALQASRGLTATPDCCPTAAHPQNETILRSPALLGIAAPPHPSLPLASRRQASKQPPKELALSSLTTQSIGSREILDRRWRGASKH